MPDWKQIVRGQLAPLRLPPEREIEIAEELAQHLDAVYDAARADGASEQEAYQQSAAQIRDGRLLECELSRAEQPLAAHPLLEFIKRKGGIRMESLWQDLRFGARMLAKNPGFTLIAVFTLALGIGLSTAIFSLTYSILLRALPYPDADRIVTISLTNPVAAAAGVPRFSVNAANWMEWRAQSKSFDDIALARVALNFNLTGDGRPERVQGARASWNLSQVLGAQPRLGRMFTEEEAGRDAKVAVLSDGFWERRFARDPAIVGRRIQLNGEAFEVISVMPPEFRYPTKDFDLLAPLFIPPDETRSPSHFYYKAVGRLKTGVSMRQAQAETSAITERLAQQRPRSKGVQDGTWVESLLDTNVGQFRTTLYVLLAAVGCLLLIGCINLGGLLIVRASARTHEFAIRAALGASTSRLRGQTLAEVLPLGIVGAGAGVLLAWALLKVLVRFLPPQLPGLDSIGLHVPVLAFALALSVLVVLLAGMLPARLAARVRLAETIQQGSRTVAGGGTVRNALLTAQIAVTLVLVFAGGLLVRSLVAVLQVNPGFSPQGVLTLQLQAARTKYPTDAEVADYYHRLATRVKTIPGVIEAGAVSRLPFYEGSPSGPAVFEGKPDATVTAEFTSATHGYFAALGIPLFGGRDFSEHDKEEAPPVGIIDEQLARKVFGNESPLGKRFKFGVITERTPWIEIIGVVGHIRSGSLETDPRLQLYWPKAQQRPEAQRSQERGTLVVRTTGRPEVFTSAVVEQIQKENPDQPVYDVRSMEDRLDQSLQPRHLLTGLVALFGGAALLLACLGLYGVVSYGVALRLREFAIRTALGAEARDVRRLVLIHAVRLWLAGSALGLLAAWPVGRALQSQLYGVSSADAVALAAALSLLLVTALVAGLVPARCAGQVDPAVTLRSE
ncbi:MAG: ADOP family duplicated permease [Blastocatellia bacterium]